MPRWRDFLLKLEWLAAAAAALVAFALSGGSWLMFALLLLAPDLSMLGYLAGPRFGAFAYNLAHTLIVAIALGAVAWLAGNAFGQQLALIWIVHIALDRALGYGLKLPTSFRDTHLGRIGRD